MIMIIKEGYVTSLRCQVAGSHLPPMQQIARLAS